MLTDGQTFNIRDFRVDIFFTTNKDSSNLSWPFQTTLENVLWKCIWHFFTNQFLTCIFTSLKEIYKHVIFASTLENKIRANKINILKIKEEEKTMMWIFDPKTKSSILFKIQLIFGEFPLLNIEIYDLQSATTPKK